MGAFVDRTGQRYGKLTVISYVGNSKWKCICDCGKETVVQTGNLTNGHTVSCGCARKDIGEKLKQDLTGKRFGRLTVIGPDGRSETGHTSLWECVCDCGAKITVRGTNLKNGSSQSCGCYRHEYLVEAHTTHGGAKREGKRTKLYSVWIGMRRRYYDENDGNYHRYGGRGIEICDGWRENFAAFRAWAVKNGYRHNLTIDRIDNDKGYSPENCRWISVKEQALNRRSNRVVTFNGETHTFYEWDEILGFTRGTISRRVTSCGWSIERALTEPIHTQNRGRWLK